MYGPPGCGKTHIARHLASALAMPLYIVRFDGLVSSFLGETASNLQQVFRFFSANRCVVLLDEIDAIAKLRDDRTELGELKRVVISLLQNIDYAETRSLLVAATNHPHLLDPALWRRFDLTWEIPLPGRELRERLWQNLAVVPLERAVLRVVAEESEGMSGSDIRQIATDARRKLALEPATEPGEAILLSLVGHLRRRVPASAGIHDVTTERLPRVALALRDVASSAKYSFKRLERLTGIAHSTLHHRARAAVGA
jgi:SpoVK/Ycf46/Vps4 family AAA+-type ATPase